MLPDDRTEEAEPTARDILNIAAAIDSVNARIAADAAIERAFGGPRFDSDQALLNERRVQRIVDSGDRRKAAAALLFDDLYAVGAFDGGEGV
ncbi:hypothetical protein [Streptomyces sp. T028]|uniref:hypothetical protein n=1 Tax=Streptomyces sp. T028 TaxID=3394379 RepID=UPI003A84E928